MSITMKGGNSQLRRILGPLLSVILIAGVGAAIWYSAGNALESRRVVTVTGLIGSEKQEFFEDERVIAALPEDLQDLCEKLQSSNMAEIAREMGVPRSTLYGKLTKLRDAFRDGGLEEYL